MSVRNIRNQMKKIKHFMSLPEIWTFSNLGDSFKTPEHQEVLFVQPFKYFLTMAMYHHFYYTTCLQSTAWTETSNLSLCFTPSCWIVCFFIQKAEPSFKIIFSTLDFLLQISFGFFFNTFRIKPKLFFQVTEVYNIFQLV